LWGLGEHLFFLHDGRSNNLLDVIRQQDSPGLEASAATRNFGGLSRQDKQAGINSLWSL
jgi:CxxC motif-containing protein (DUF1111 family)